MNVINLDADDFDGRESSGSRVTEMKGLHTKSCPQKVTLLRNMVGELLENTKDRRKIDRADPDTQKAIQLSKDVIGDFPENPWAWECRHQILVILDVCWDDELEFITLLAKKDPCNSCIWRYRRRVVEKLGADAASLELKFTEEILTLDARNQYAWVHRKWVLQSFGDWEGELAFCRELIENDNYNYFAWKQRQLVVTRSNQRIRASEVDYAIIAILDQPENEFLWRYLSGIYNGYGTDEKLDRLFSHVISDVPRSIIDKFGAEDKIFKRKYLYAVETLVHLIYRGYVPGSCLTVGTLCMDGRFSGGFFGVVFDILEHADPIKSKDWEIDIEKAFKEFWARRPFFDD